MVVLKEQKYHLYLSNDEYSILIQSLIRLKNSLIAQGRYTDGVDDVLCKVLSAKKRKFKIKYFWTRKETAYTFVSGLWLLDLVWRTDIDSFLIYYQNHFYTHSIYHRKYGLLHKSFTKTLILMILATLSGTPRLLHCRTARTPGISNRLPLLRRWQSEG